MPVCNGTVGSFIILYLMFLMHDEGKTSIIILLPMFPDNHVGWCVDIGLYVKSYFLNCSNLYVVLFHEVDYFR